jgi:hypothetical protein
VDLVLGFVLSFLASLLAVLIALYIERRRQPRVVLTATESANAAIEYNDTARQPWGRVKFYRLQVENVPFPKPFRWIPRQSAEGCRATLDFTDADGDLVFSMHGRWSSTPEPAFLKDEERLLRVIYPDPVTIPVRAVEFLDVFIWHDQTKEAYGWNNDAYLGPAVWKPAHHKLEHREYRLRVRLSLQNGGMVDDEFSVVIGDSIEQTGIRARDGAS